MRHNAMRTKVLLGVGAAALAAVGATSALGGSSGETAAAKPTLAVVVVGSGRVTSQPAGISCPGKCVATFARGTAVVLMPKVKTGSRFLRWGGDCSGARACRVKVSALSAVAAQFAGSSTQPPPTTAVEPGTYLGANISFYVPAGASRVQNFTHPGVGIDCPGGGGFGYPFKILQTAIRPDRSFTARTSESGVIRNVSATITYSVTGRFQGRDSAGRATASGIYRMDIVFSDGRKCTSNDDPWTATRSLPPARGSVEPGTYTGPNISYFVPAGAGRMQNFTHPGVSVDCPGGGGFGYPFKIPQATIGPDRSFTAKTSESAVVRGSNATITYSVTGYFQGPDSAGRATAAGVYRMDIAFTDNRRCTSNDDPWTAARTGS